MSSADWYQPPNGGDINYLMIQQMIQQALQMQTNARIVGAITADSGTLQQLSVKGDLELDSGGTLTAAATYPATAARATMGAGGFATFNATPVQTAGFNIDGSGFIGVGGSTMSWTAGGVVTIPVAAIGSLTIANVGSGVLGGTYKTSSGTGARLEFDTAGFRAYNASNVQTVLIDAGTGNITLTGQLTVNAVSGAGIIVLNSDGSFGDVFKMQNAGVDKGSIYATGGAFTMVYGSFSSPGATLSLSASSWLLGSPGGSELQNTGTKDVLFTGAIFLNNQAVRSISDDGTQTTVSASLKVGGALRSSGNIFPAGSTTGAFTWDATHAFLQQTGGTGFEVTGLLKLANTGTGASGGLPAPTKYLQIVDSSSNNRYIPIFSAPFPWTA